MENKSPTQSAVTYTMTNGQLIESKPPITPTIAFSGAHINMQWQRAKDNFDLWQARKDAFEQCTLEVQQAVNNQSSQSASVEL